MALPALVSIDRTDNVFFCPFLVLGTHLDDYVLVGCFADSQSLRIMFNKQSEDIMSASVSCTVYVCCVHLSTVYTHTAVCV